MTMPLNPALKVLAFDTSSARGSVALLLGREVAAELRLNALQTHSARLLRSIDFLLETLGWALSDVDLVAAGIGPGSFTGIRIGVATALGIAQPLGVPFAGISGLDAIAHEVSYLNGHIGVLMDARRSQAYYAEYVSEGGRIRIAQKPALWHLFDLERRLSRRHLYIVSDAADRHIQSLKISSAGWPRLVDVDFFLAAGVGRLAFSRKRIWRSGDFLNWEPLYIRPPDALRTKDRAR